MKKIAFILSVIFDCLGLLALILKYFTSQDAVWKIIEDVSFSVQFVFSFPLTINLWISDRSHHIVAKNGSGFQNIGDNTGKQEFIAAGRDVNLGFDQDKKEITDIFKNCSDIYDSSRCLIAMFEKQIPFWENTNNIINNARPVYRDLSLKTKKEESAISPYITSTKLDERLKQSIVSINLFLNAVDSLLKAISPLGSDNFTASLLVDYSEYQKAITEQIKQSIEQSKKNLVSPVE
jgi:hypothetical protein